MSNKLDRQALKAYVHKMIADERAELGEAGVNAILEQGERWKLGPTLRDGGSIIIPHAGLKVCGHQIAACAQACIDSGADRVLAIGVLHALTDELQEARVRVANGADVTKEKYWGVQGPGLGGFNDWETEYSLLDFLFLLDAEAKRRGVKAPEVSVRYPYLVGGRPMILPGMKELQAIAKDAVIISTADAFHHGIAYGDSPDKAVFFEKGGRELAHQTIQEGLDLLRIGDYWGYNQHCVTAKSDARDAGSVVRYLLGPLEGHILDITYADMTTMYQSPAPSWVTAALIEQRRVNE
jgi:hypothetical protein